MAKIKYRSAFDDNNNLVDIKNVKEEDRKIHTYHCITCGEPLLARLGKKRVHHFCHEKDTVCDGESYLHKLAKLRLKEKFDKSEHFYISYKTKTICNEINCCSRNTKCTHYDDIYNKIDLKENYDTVQIEEEIKANDGRTYKADVLLSKSNNPNIQSILLEIRVFHQCSQDKLNSGLQIIEFRINNEEDIDTLITQDSYDESKDKITFHSFNRDIMTDLSSESYCLKYIKQQLKEKIEKSGNFAISYKTQNIVCNKANCKLRSLGCEQHHEEIKNINLKNYDTVAIDGLVNGYRADILLTSSKPNIAPILLLLNYNKSSDIALINSGLQIIEMKIDNEGDLDKLINQNAITESSYRTIFHSFNKVIEKEYSITIFRYILNYNEVSFINIQCKRADTRINQDSVLELNSSQFVLDGKKHALYWAYKYKGFRHCNICKHYNPYRDKCECRELNLAIYKQPQYEPKIIRANKCSHFRIDKDLSNFEFDAEEVEPDKTFNINDYESIYTVKQKPDYKVFIKNEISDYDLFRDKCNEILKSDSEDKNVIIVCNDNEFCKKYANDYDLSIVNTKIIPDLFTSEEEVLQKELFDVDAVIVFWNGENPSIAQFIDEAKKKGIPFYIVETKL